MAPFKIWIYATVIELILSDDAFFVIVYCLYIIFPVKIDNAFEAR